jgi:hypothetical protein
MIFVQKQKWKSVAFETIAKTFGRFKTFKTKHK